MPYTVEDFKTVHNASEVIERNAISFGARVGRLDASTSKDLLTKAVDSLLSSNKTLTEINNLSAYLFVVYKRIVILWCEKKQKEESLDGNTEAVKYYHDIERKILIEEIVRLMNDQERFIYNYLVLGYSYSEIAEKYNQAFKTNFSANVLRSKFSKMTQKIAKKLLLE